MRKIEREGGRKKEQKGKKKKKQKKEKLALQTVSKIYEEKNKKKQFSLIFLSS